MLEVDGLNSRLFCQRMISGQPNEELGKERVHCEIEETCCGKDELCEPDVTARRHLVNLITMGSAHLTDVDRV